MNCTDFEARQAMMLALGELIREAESKLQELRQRCEEVQLNIDREVHHLEALRYKQNRCVHEVAESTTNQLSIADWIYQLLLDGDREMQANEIIRELDLLGIAAQAESSVLSALSRRSDLFERVARGRYRLKGNRKADRIASRQCGQVVLT